MLSFSLHRLCALCLAVCLITSVALNLRATEAPAEGRRALALELSGQWIGSGLCFSPYREGQDPDGAQPTEEQILADLRLIAPTWHLIRLYESSPIAERILALIRREHLPIRVFVGAWVGTNQTPEQQSRNRGQLTRTIQLARDYPDVVTAVIVGNEACVEWSDHRVDALTLLQWVQEVRKAVKQPVTVADDYNFWNKPESKPVAAAVDFITLHAYSLWNGRQIDDAVPWMTSIYDQIAAYHAGIPMIIGETGWATQYDPTRTKPGEEGVLMKGEVSVAAQEKYLRQHYRWLAERHVATFLFEAFDESWKGGGKSTSPAAVEKHWGVFDVNRRPKPSLAAVLREQKNASRE